MNVNSGRQKQEEFMSAMTTKAQPRSIILNESQIVYQYVDNYAGQYVDEDGRFHLCVKEDINRWQHAQSQSLNNEQNVVYETKKFSYNELSNIKNAIKLVGIEFKISKIGISNAENCVVVYHDISINKNDIINYLVSENIYKEGIVKFIEKPWLSTIPTATKIANIAEKAWCNYGFLLTTKELCTIGVNARDRGTNQYGIITAGHTAGLNRDMKVKAGTIGRATKTQHSGSIDAAFVPFKKQSDWSCSGKIEGSIYGGTTNYGNTKYSRDDVWLTENMRIYQFGSATGRQLGHIVDNDAITIMDYDDGAVYIDNAIETSIIAQPGDSGGPIYASGGPKGSMWLIGFIMGGNGETSVACQAKLVEDIFNVEFITVS